MSGKPNYQEECRHCDVVTNTRAPHLLQVSKVMQPEGAWELCPHYMFKVFVVESNFQLSDNIAVVAAGVFKGKPKFSRN
jgi:hypothetical protein